MYVLQNDNIYRELNLSISDPTPRTSCVLPERNVSTRAHVGMCTHVHTRFANTTDARGLGKQVR